MLFFAFALAGAACAAATPETQAIATVAPHALPPEARHTLTLIREGGPYAHERDGVVFGNRERLLPLHARGYYREYTVPTPGVKHRGARRIVAGRSGELYYTEDHYRSFKRIVE
jgi:ribonuclease T1